MDAQPRGGLAWRPIRLQVRTLVGDSTTRPLRLGRCGTFAPTHFSKDNATMQQSNSTASSCGVHICSASESYNTTLLLERNVVFTPPDD